ncbi:CapA family protein [Agrococcus carbonis]|uniref:Poly-gamma-glutamate synthesis protein (Capsule biosynthesis protein) n=1 Tax=Agrococcus carbonis TaxID=684552 RepID=A0A1H1N0H8_9MICO|nr:CapA family protein [Agrococcus carbonis]SDR92205.1 poly-gamma-glutamate synthesis protein (capsule biosynthesis protein) [Agrococcus carbonis]
MSAARLVRPTRAERRIRPVRAAAVGLLALAALAGCAAPAPQPTAEPTAAPPEPATASPVPSATPTETVVEVSALGDMLPHQTILDGARTADGWDFTPYLADIAPVLDSSGLVTCNLEAPVAGDALGVRAYPAFNAPSAFARDLAASGCDAFSTANNHALDAGVEGLERTADVLDALPVVWHGTARSAEEQRMPAITEVDGVRIALVSATALTNVAGPATSLSMLSDRPLIEQLMATAEAEADVVVVAAHWGVEYAPTVSPAQREAAEWLSSLGADVIIGTHPHVLEPVEWVESDAGRTLVWYSLGNALSSQIDVPRVFSAIGRFDIARTADGAIEIREPRAIPIYMHFDWSVADRRAGVLETRSNPHLYLLEDAAEPLTRSAWETTVDEQRAAIAAALGPEVTLVDR